MSKMNEMNFSEPEKKFLFDLVMRNRDIFDNPKNDPPTQAMKSKKLAEITNEFNKHFPENKKTIDQMRKIWELAKRWSSDTKLFKMSAAVGGSGEPVYDEMDRAQRSKTKRRNAAHVNQEEYKPDDVANLGTRAIQLAARLRERRVMNKTKQHQELREIAKKEQEVRIMVTKELLEQEKIKTQYLQNKVKEHELKLKMYNKK